MLFCHNVHIVVHGFCVVDMVVGMVGYALRMIRAVTILILRLYG